MSVLAGGGRLDQLNRRFGVHDMRPLRGANPSAAANGLAPRSARRAGRTSSSASLPDFSRTYVLDVGRRGDLKEIARTYAADPAVEYCEPDFVVRTLLSPNDPYFSSSGSWGQGFSDLWGVQKINTPAAWDTTRGAGVLVAVVDTGIDYTHPDIAANVWTNPAEIPGNGIDDDGNGYIDDVHGWDFADRDSDPIDDNFHGTHVAGTIAAVGNNALGVVGVAFESQVMAVRGLNRYGYGSSSDLAEAILYAVDNGADVINASWGGGGSSTTISDAVAYAHAAGVVFVAAAGNDDADTSGQFPANDPNAITVAASNHLDQRASFSNFGVKLDVTAPGGGDAPPPQTLPLYSVLSLYSSASAAPLTSQLLVGGQYLRLAGTSMAAPHASGAAALVLSVHPEYSAEQVRQVLRTTADDVGAPGPDVDSGYGRVNAAAAVLAPPPLEAHISAPSAGRIAAGPLIAIEGSASGPGFVSYTLEYGPAPSPSTWTTIAGPIATAVTDGPLGEWDIGEVLDGDYVLQLRVERAGETFTDRVPLTLVSVSIDTPERFAALHTDVPVEIRGTAAGAGFTSYAVEYRRPGLDRTLWRTDGITLASPGTRVYGGLLATFDVSGLTQGDRFDFRVTVQNANGTVARTRSGIAIDPTLRAGWPQSLIRVGDRQYLTVADLDNDGIKEILVGSGDEVIVFEPDGSVRPGWPKSVVTTDPLVETQGSPIVADVTGDEKPEVIATNRTELLVWSADGVLQPGFPRVVDSFVGVLNQWLTAGDLDGDGKDEILCTGVFSVQAFYGNGQVVPGWDRRSISDTPMVPADVLGDARAEVATHLEYFTSGKKHRLALRGPDAQLLPRWPKSARGSFFSRAGMADMDGDGQLDVVLLQENYNNVIKVRAFTAQGRRIGLTRLRGVKRSLLKMSNGLLSYADLDRDGLAEAYYYARVDVEDILAPGDFGYFVTVQNRRTEPIQAPLIHQIFRSDGPAGVAIGDIDGDGVQELVAGVEGDDKSGQGGGYIYDFVRRAVVAQRLDGTLSPQFPKPVPQFVPEEDDPPGYYIFVVGWIDDPRYATPAIADLDGDGLKEVLWMDPLFTRLFIWNVAGTPGPELADWPMYHHDPKHTNVLPVIP